MKRWVHLHVLRTDRQTSMPDQCSAHTVSDSLHPWSGEHANTWHSHVRRQLLPLARAPAPAKNKMQVAEGRPDLCPTPPQDNQPFVVLFSAGSGSTVCSRTTFPLHCVLCSVLPQSCSDATRAGRRQQTRQEHITNGTSMVTES